MSDGKEWVCDHLDSCKDCKNEIKQLEQENAELKLRVEAGNDCIDVELAKKKDLESLCARMAEALDMFVGHKWIDWAQENGYECVGDGWRAWIEKAKLALADYHKTKEKP